ncbi:Receptor-type tyrosine-protein phosphatase F [Orchesella cincta]|uniref:Receptor-type tyrosine-protein phosphatase F n=1 Tax=Orchesella cincta TaxID=48709 RepID=A0A1D2N9V9_ORCCI|nr:Receptor-type tyrosine-protein phosphatase F [Orchesella cincta]
MLQTPKTKCGTNLVVTTDGEPPSGPPQYVTVEPVSSTEFRISWQPPAKDHRHGQILGYSVGIKRTR